MNTPLNAKVPFASYDIAVYFGVGIIVLPFLIYVIDAIEVIKQNSSIFDDSGLSFTFNTFVIVFGLFSAYSIGHIIALLSSYIVEKFIHYWLGYPSDVWKKFAPGEDAEYFNHVKAHIKDRASLPLIIGLVILYLPIIVPIIFIYLFKLFGFYRPKLPIELASKLELKLKSTLDDFVFKNDDGVETKIFWMKIVEHEVANNNPMGYARLYNYLVIFGVLRSLALVFLIVSWFFILPPISDWKGAGIGNLEFDSYRLQMFLIFSAVTTLTFIGFSKFNRRFFEEAVYAFTLVQENDRQKYDIRFPQIEEYGARAEDLAKEEAAKPAAK